MERTRRPLNDFYVYVIFRPSGVPCYVGKGRGRRWAVPHSGNQRLQRIIEKYGASLPKVKVREHLTETQAFETEVALITALGRTVDGGPLVNVVLGGGGVSGLQHNPETRKRIAEGLRGLIRPEKTRQKMSQSQQGHHVSDAARQLMSQAKVGTAHHTSPHSAETKERISASVRARFQDEAEREKVRQRTIKQWADPVAKQNHQRAAAAWGANPLNRKKLSDAKIGKPLAPAHAAAIKAAKAAKRNSN